MTNRVTTTTQSSFGGKNNRANQLMALKKVLKPAGNDLSRPSKATGQRPFGP